MIAEWWCSIRTGPNMTHDLRLKTKCLLAVFRLDIVKQKTRNEIRYKLELSHNCSLSTSLVNMKINFKHSVKAYPRQSSFVL